MPTTSVKHNDMNLSTRPIEAATALALSATDVAACSWMSGTVGGSTCTTLHPLCSGLDAGMAGDRPSEEGGDFMRPPLVPHSRSSTAALITSRAAANMPCIYLLRNCKKDSKAHFVFHRSLPRGMQQLGSCKTSNRLAKSTSEDEASKKTSNCVKQFRKAVILFHPLPLAALLEVPESQLAVGFLTMVAKVIPSTRRQAHLCLVQRSGKLLQRQREHVAECVASKMRDLLQD